MQNEAAMVAAGERHHQQGLQRRSGVATATAGGRHRRPRQRSWAPGTAAAGARHQWRRRPRGAATAETWNRLRLSRKQSPREAGVTAAGGHHRQKEKQRPKGTATAAMGGASPRARAAEAGEGGDSSSWEAGPPAGEEEARWGRDIELAAGGRHIQQFRQKPKGAETAVAGSHHRRPGWQGPGWAASSGGGAPPTAGAAEAG